MAPTSHHSKGNPHVHRNKPARLLQSRPKIIIAVTISIIFAWSQLHLFPQQRTDNDNVVVRGRSWRPETPLLVAVGVHNDDDDDDDDDDLDLDLDLDYDKNDKDDWKKEQNSNSPDNVVVVFVSLLGLEGTGHHLYQHLFEHSPSHQRLVEWNLYPDTVGKLVRLLWNQAKQYHALFSAPCASTATKHKVNATATQQKIVRLLRHVHHEIAKRHHNHKDKDNSTTSTFHTPIAVPLTSVRFRKSGYMSYPNYQGPCRTLQYPDLFLLEQELCQEAGVFCQYIVGHRDAWEILRSTLIHRRFDTLPLRQVKTLTTMAHVLRSQILSSSLRNRVAACWNFNQEDEEEDQDDDEEEEDDDEEEEDEETTTTSQDPAASSRRRRRRRRRRAAPLDMGRLLGWRDDVNDDDDAAASSSLSLNVPPNHTMHHFVKLYQSNFDRYKSAPLTQGEKDALIPPSMQLYVESFVHATQELRLTCERLLQQQQGQQLGPQGRR